MRQQPQPVLDAHPHITGTDCRRRITGLGIVGGAVVSGSFQAFDPQTARTRAGAVGAEPRQRGGHGEGCTS